MELSLQNLKSYLNSINVGLNSKKDETNLELEISNIITACIAIVDSLLEDTRIGDLAELETDHKSHIVAAINELAEIAETPNFIISFEKTSEELKEVYDACFENLVLAKNIVFYNSVDELYYRVNGYNMVSGVLKLHAIMQGDSGLVDTVVSLSSNGTLSVQ